MDIKNLINTKFEVPSQVEKWLVNNGFKHIGSGMFSIAYSDGDKVVKIRGDDTSLDVRCMLGFHDLAKYNPNPHFPKIYNISRYKNNPTETFYIIVTELLYETGPMQIISEVDKEVSNDKIRKMMYGFVSLATNIVRPQFVYDQYMKDKNVKVIYPKNKKVDGHEILKVRNDLANQFINIYPKHSWVQAYDIIINFAANDSGLCFSDIGGNNIMQRKDGTIVYSDPIGDQNYQILDF